MENQQISVASKREKQCFFFPSSFCVQEQSSMFHPPPPNTVCLILITKAFPNLYCNPTIFVFSFCYLKQKDDNKYKLKYKENVRRIDGNRHLVEAMNNLETKLNTLMKCLKQLQ